MFDPSLDAYTYLFFFFNDTATTEIYTLSLHDALPISAPQPGAAAHVTQVAKCPADSAVACGERVCFAADRKSTRLNSSHSQISYAVFCLKKKKKQKCRSNRAYSKSNSKLARASAGSKE